MPLLPRIALLLAFPLSGLVSPAVAAGSRTPERGAAMSGRRLTIESPCARHVDIVPRATLHDQVIVHASADHQEELDRLVLDEQGSIRIGTAAPGCWRPDRNFTSTLDLIVDVPPGFALSVEESGSARYVVGPVGGTLETDISGEATLSDGAATHVNVALSGAGAVTLAQVEGNARFDLSGFGKIVVDRAAMTKLSISISGTGAVNVVHGQIGTAAVQSSGAGEIGIGADVGAADVSLSGAGSVHFAKVAGALNKAVSGIGTVTVGE